jgi:hypothetical protein
VRISPFSLAAMLAVAGPAMLAAPLPARAQGQGIAGSFEGDFENRPWSEVAAHMPKFPDPSDLMEIHVAGEQDTKFLIDLASVDLGSDAIIRYTLLTRSSSGAESLNYEGMRCSSMERKVYAFGRSNRSWDKAQNAKWRDIVLKGGVNSYHAALYLSYFCQKRMPLASRQVLIETIKKGGLPPERHD